MAQVITALLFVQAAATICLFSVLLWVFIDNWLEKKRWTAYLKKRIAQDEIMDRKKEN